MSKTPKWNPTPTLLQMLPPPSPTPSHKSISAWRGPTVPAPASGASMNNRPLPEPPRPAPSEGGGSSRSGTPKSVFDTIQRPPSVQLERIKTKASATLDRMAQLQQRYRQQKASQLELNTSGSEQVSSRVWVLTRSQTCLSFPTSMYIVSFRLSHFVLVFPLSRSRSLSLSVHLPRSSIWRTAPTSSIGQTFHHRPRIFVPAACHLV